MSTNIITISEMVMTGIDAGINDLKYLFLELQRHYNNTTLK